MISTQPGGTPVSKEAAPAPGAQEKNKAFVRRFFEARGKGDLDALEELFGPRLRRPQLASRAKTLETRGGYIQ